MIWIEMAGSIGAGKTSLAAALRKFIQDNGCAALSPDEAIRIRFERSLLRHTGKPVHPKVYKLYEQSAGMYAKTRFSLKNPALIWQVLASRNARRDLPGWHRRRILTLFFKLAGWYEWFTADKNGNEFMVMDEGFAQRAINLFAWESGGVDLKRLRAYLTDLPVVDLLIIIRVPLEYSMQRSLTRGLPLRLRGKDPQYIRRFFENADTIVCETARIYSLNNRRRVIELSNAGDLDQAIREMQSEFLATGLIFPKK